MLNLLTTALGFVALWALGRQSLFVYRAEQLFLGQLAATTVLEAGLLTWMFRGLALSKFKLWGSSVVMNVPSYCFLFGVFYLTYTQHNKMGLYRLRDNLRAFSTMVEIYAVDYAGQSPPSIEALEQAAKNPGDGLSPYWKPLYRASDLLGFMGQELNPHESAVLHSGEPPRTYTIEYRPLKDAKGRVFGCQLRGYAWNIKPKSEKSMQILTYDGKKWNANYPFYH